jgi:hypothetical protein
MSKKGQHSPAPECSTYGTKFPKYCIELTQVSEVLSTYAEGRFSEFNRTIIMEPVG